MTCECIVIVQFMCDRVKVGVLRMVARSSIFFFLSSNFATSFHEMMTYLRELYYSQLKTFHLPRNQQLAVCVLVLSSKLDSVGDHYSGVKRCKTDHFFPLNASTQANNEFRQAGRVGNIFNTPHFCRLPRKTPFTACNEYYKQNQIFYLKFCLPVGSLVLSSLHKRQLRVVEILAYPRGD